MLSLTNSYPSLKTTTRKKILAENELIASFSQRYLRLLDANIFPNQNLNLVYKNISDQKLHLT